MNEFLYRRADIEDVMAAHLLAMERAPSVGFGPFIISATTPFRREDCGELRADRGRIEGLPIPAAAQRNKRR